MARTSSIFATSEDQKRIKDSLLIAAGFVALLWLIKLFEIWLGTSFAGFGIFPREAKGLFGIIFSPLIHSEGLIFHDGKLSHLASNTGPVFVLLASLFYFYRKVAVKAVLGIWLMTGVWVWLGARGGNPHVGASGLIYGFAAFIFFSGLLRKDVKSLTISLFVGFLYGGMIWGILPGDEFISWESHLFGGVAGLVMAWFFRKVETVPKKKYSWENEPEHDPRDARGVWNYQNFQPNLPKEELDRIREGIGEDD